MVPFAIGSETAGSITYPASRCGVTALRPTFGTVGRTGVLSLSESLVISLHRRRLLESSIIHHFLLWEYFSLTFNAVCLTG